MIPENLTIEAVDAHISEECATLPDVKVLQKLESAKNLQNDARLQVSRTAYIIGKEISKGQLDSLKESYNDMMKQYPEEEIPVTKWVWNDDKKVAETKITYRYKNKTPVGQDGSPLEDLSHVEVLNDFAIISDADKMALSKLRDALETATTVDEYKTAQDTLHSEENRLIKELKIPKQMYILKNNLTEYHVTKAEHKWEKANKLLRFAQFKVLAYQCEMSRRATEAKKVKVLDKAAKFMTTAGIEMVGKYL